MLQILHFLPQPLQNLIFYPPSDLEHVIVALLGVVGVQINEILVVVSLNKLHTSALPLDTLTLRFLHLEAYLILYRELNFLGYIFNYLVFLLEIVTQ